MRILIVEDERYLADAISEIIKREKYLLDTVYDGEEGYAYASSGIYDCIILDIMLPKMNGIEVLKRLRRENISTPVLLLTAKNTIEDKVSGLDSGADDYMTKPFSTEELLARIRTLTRRRAEIIPNELSFADAVLVTDESELRSALTGKVIRLSFKETEIMKIFLSSPKKIISKDELIVKVWGYDSNATDNNVEAYITFLRKKLLFIAITNETVSFSYIGKRNPKSSGDMSPLPSVFTGSGSVFQDSSLIVILSFIAHFPSHLSRGIFAENRCSAFPFSILLSTLYFDSSSSIPSPYTD